jgi:mannonate dehydratase
MNRRELLKLTSAASATGLIANSLTTPLRAAAVASVGLPRLKVTDVKVITTQVGGNHLTNCKVFTSEPGLYGVGCGTHAERQLIVAETIDKFLKPMIVGHYVDEIEKFWQTAWVAPYWRASVDANNAMSAVDGALWDIMGKRAGMPVYDLMGGKVREGCRMFANAGGRSLQDLEDNVRKSMEAGFQHVRISPVSANGGGRGGGAGAGAGAGAAPPQGDEGPGGMHTDDGEYIASVVDSFDHIRKTVGWQVEIGTDVHERPTPGGAIRLAKAVEQYRPFFMEDLFAPEDSAWYQRVREQSSIQVAMGELFVNQNEWLPLVSNRWIDFMRMHISAAGGLNLARKVAHCCEFYGVRTAWHGPANVSPIGHMVNLQLDLSLINFGIGEGGGFSDQLKELFPGTPEIIKGVRYASDRPGLGIDINETAAAKYPVTSPGSNRGSQDSEGAPRRP